MPSALTGKQCSDPYDCPFVSFCKTQESPEPQHPIELLPDSAGKALARTLREGKGYTSILEPAPEELIGKAEGLLRAGNVPAALETFRTIGRYPDQLAPAIGRLNGLLHDPDYDAYHDEIRQLLVDAYLAQGDYDRANLLRKLGG